MTEREERVPIGEVYDHVHLVCEQCDKGHMLYAGTSRTAPYEQHYHRCDSCTYDKWYERKYPYRRKRRDASGNGGENHE